MESFLRALQGVAAGRTELSTLRATLEQLIIRSPESSSAAAVALKNAHQRGILPSAEFQALLATLDRHGRGAAAPRAGARSPPLGNAAEGDETAPHAAGTAAARAASAIRSPPAPPSPNADATTFRARPRVDPGAAPTAFKSGPAVADTKSRLGDPLTWTQVDDDPLFVGRVLGRHYQLERKIGEGGMGVVYLARDLIEADFSEQPFLAIKVLKPDFRQHPDALKALHEEVRKSRALSHQNIVSVYTFDRDGAVVFMTMEYLEGKPLNELIDEDFARGMPYAQAWPIIEGAGRALAYAHDRGVVHSDFKPSNVFVTAGGRPKVLDFGIARAMRQGRNRGFDAGSLGALTVAYASCEMLDGQAPDLRDDVYAYACVIYELLSGRHVFGGDSAAQARDAKLKMQPLAVLSKQQNKILARALAFDRSQRIGSIEELIEGLRPQPPVRRTGMIVAGAMFGACALAAVGWWASHKYLAADEDERFVNSLVKPNAEAADNIDPETVNLLMEQGDGYLAQARDDFNPAFLSEGVSTAYGAFQAVLKQDPANRLAAEKILQIVKMYEEHATALAEQGQFKRALNLVGYALKIDPASPALMRMQNDLKPKAASETDPSP